MDKETLSNYRWIVIAVLVLVVMIALATPFGSFVSEAVQSTTKGLFDVNKTALNAAGVPGLTVQDQEFDVPDMNHGANKNVKTLVITEEGIYTVGTIQYEEGMTWAEWAESKYNVPMNYRSDDFGENSFILHSEGNYLMYGPWLTLSDGDPDGEFRQDIANDIIDSTKTYFLTL